MRACLCGLTPKPNRAKRPLQRRRVERREQRERILRERVTYMLWVLANRVD